MLLFTTLYVISTVLLAVYGFNSFVLAFLYLRHRRDEAITLPITDWPSVTVQLPIFDELYVVERLIDAAAAIDYPRERLQIQVLDDSNDETTMLAQSRVNYHRARGIDIALLHRRDRSGFKAGALADGLDAATGEFIAIFDADFIPPVDFLRRTIPCFSNRPRLGLVQARWGHLNADYSLLTRAQAISLDGQFIVEQTARNRSGLLITFNGTAGVWRKSCIVDTGGWQDDTLCEDLDLSYRAQMAGWETLMLPDVVVPAEIPPQLNGLKRQQFRWAKGSIQVAMKLMPQLLRSRLSLAARLEGLIHLTRHLAHPLMLLLFFTAIPLLWGRVPIHLSLACLGLASLGPPTTYVLSQRALYRDWRERFAYLPILVLLGSGLALNNTVAVYEALTHKGNHFRRTPKFRIEGSADDWMGKRYALSFNWIALGELALSAYACVGVFVALASGNDLAAPFLLLYGLGFSYVGLLSIAHSLPPLGMLVRFPAMASLRKPQHDFASGAGD